jgi:hypothetical protein
MTNIKELIIAVSLLVSKLIVIMMGVGVLVFFWGLVKFLFQGGDEKAVSQGKNTMLWGIISLFLMTTIWGVIQFIQIALLPDISLPAETTISNDSAIPPRTQHSGLVTPNN